MKWLRTPIMKRTLGKLSLPIALGVARTLRLKSNNNGQITDPWDPALRETFIYSMWHGTLLGALTMRSCVPVAALISQSDDGAALTYLCNAFGVRTIRGSSTRGGSEAAQEVLEQTVGAHLMIAPDGPKGPRRKVKRGVSYLASWSGKAIVPLGIGFGNALRFRTWDRFVFPIAFSTVYFVAGPVLRVPANINKRQSEEYRAELELRMNHAQANASAWAGEKSEAAEEDEVEVRHAA